MEWCLIIKVMFSGGGGLCLVTQPLCSRAVLDDALQDEGCHGGVDHVVGHPALGQSGLLVFARVDIVSELRREERLVSQTLTVYLHYPGNYPGLLSTPDLRMRVEHRPEQRRARPWVAAWVSGGAPQCPSIDPFLTLSHKDAAKGNKCH